uniref:Uncharacterized protein n=1 Tax=Rhizophora mucronata TaxID=61149 RepID=A0A2P2PT71_RHIMU
MPSAETSSGKVIGLPWLWTTSGMPRSTAHLSDTECMYLSTWLYK